MSRRRSLSILDAGGLTPGRTRRAGRAALWGTALAVALLMHLAFLVEFENQTEAAEDTAGQKAPITVSEESIEALLGEDQKPPEPAPEEEASPEPEEAQDDPAQQESAAAASLPAEEERPEEVLPPQEIFDPPDINATFTSLTDGDASNPSEGDTPAETEVEPPAETTEEAPPDVAPEPEPAPQDTADQSEPAPAESADQTTETGTDAATTDAPGTKPGGAPTETPGAPAPAQPSLALPDISSAFAAVSGQSPDHAAALPEVATEDDAAALPDSAAGPSTDAAPVERPADPFYPFPTARPGPAERAATVAVADPTLDASAFDRVPLPTANPAPKEQRAAAAPKAAAEPTRTTSTAPQQPSGAEASYARAVRAIVGQAFFTAASRGQVVGAGTAVVTVRISRDGSFIDASVTTPSGNASLDRAVLAAARNSFPRFPDSVADRSLSFSVPVRVR